MKCKLSSILTTIRQEPSAKINLHGEPHYDALLVHPQNGAATGGVEFNLKLQTNLVDQFATNLSHLVQQ